MTTPLADKPAPAPPTPASSVAEVRRLATEAGP